MLRAHASLIDGSTRRLLVKISQDQSVLLREVINSIKALGLYGPSLVVPYQHIESTLKKRSGWSAIAMVFAENTVTFRKWISQTESTAQVQGMLCQLFLNRGLASAYTEHLNSSADAASPDMKPIERLVLTPPRRLLVRAAVETLLPVLAHPDGGGVSDIADALQRIEAFSKEGRIGAISAADTPSDLVLVNAHGDLHGANVLVCTDRHARPLIIDFATFDAHHWSTDPARLMVDMVLHSLDLPIEAYLWRRLPSWRSIMRNAALLDQEAVDDDPLNLGVISALRWMSAHRQQILPQLSSPYRWWEWHVSLAEQLLRGMYHPDLPPAKKALAFIAAYDQLVLAEERMPPRRPTF